MLIDNAFFACVPPEDGKSARRASVDPPMKVFIRHLVLDVNEKNIDLHLRCLRRLDWTNETIADWCLRYLASPWLISYSNLRNLASAVAGLQALSYHDWTAIWVVDAVLEMIRLSLEVPGVFNQWAMACVTYIGELYNYSVCDSSVIFKVDFPTEDEGELEDEDSRAPPIRSLHQITEEDE
uniref:Uncharacterized protein n=1 Tax=Heterorhabditis bacteriophora TaxID=37862 RepID=A0A1I7XIZ6_HETBA